MINRKQKGFTLVELVLATVFVSILLISIVLVIIQASNIYNRGLTLKEVDTVGREIAQHLRQDIARQKTFLIDPDVNFVALGIDSGRYCLGEYSYVWNGAEDLSSDPAVIRNKYTSPATRDIRFIKVKDNNGTLCQGEQDLADPSLPLIYPSINLSDAVELIGAKSNFLALHKFKIDLIKNSGTGGAVYKIEYTLGTQDKSLIDSSGCKSPDQTSKRDFSYCALNEFMVIARTSE